MSVAVAREYAAGVSSSWAGGLVDGPTALPPPASADARPTLLVTTVDIGEGRSGRIEIREGDDPAEVAWAFCRVHGLPDAIVGPLAAHLQENIDHESEGGGTDELPSSEPASARGANAAVEEHCLQRQQQQQQELVPAAAAEQQQQPYSMQQQEQQRDQERMGIDPASSFKRKLTAHREQQRSLMAAENQQQQRKQEGVRLERSRSLPSESPSKGGIDGLDGAACGPLVTFRPASSNSAISAAYYGGPGGGSASALARQLGYQVTRGGGNVVDRLYRDAFRKQARLEEERRLRDLEIQLKTEQVHVTPVSQALAAHRTQGAYANYGERLYAEGRIEAMRKEQEAEQLRQAEEKEELEGLTFRPEISKLARALKAQEVAHAGGGLPACERLYYKSATAKRQVGGAGDGAGQRRQLVPPAAVTAKTQERMESIRREEAAAEMAECTFAPRINDRSVRMVAQRQRILKDSGIAPCEQLYNDSMRRRLKQEAAAARLPEEATFMPRVNRSSVVLRRLTEQARAAGAGGGAGSEADSGSADVAARLLDRGRQYQAKLAAARAALVERPVDPATGRPLFQPETCRPPRFQRNPEGVPVGEYLYSIQGEWDQRAAAARRATDHRAERDASSTYVNQRSEALVERLKRERFRAVFDYLRRGDRAPVINLTAVVEDAEFMDTIDPEVRADIEYAARILSKAIAHRNADAASGDAVADTAGTAPSRPGSAGSSGAPMPVGGAGAGGSRLAAVCAQSTAGEVDEAGFLVLMDEYLLPMPATERRKFDEPTFAPRIDRNSQLIAARRRPDGLPAHELLYETAREIAAKKEAARRALEAKALAECRFRPALVAAPLAKEGRALRLAGSGAPSAPTSRRGSEEAEDEAAHQAQGQGAAGAQKGAGGGAEDEMVHIDALERQINDALVRLSLTGEQVAAHLAVQGQQQGAAQQQGKAAAAAAAIDARQSLDYRALFGSPGPVEMAAMSERAAGAASSSGAYLSAVAAGEGLGASAATPASKPKPEAGAIEWVDSDDAVVANLVSEEAETAGALAGLDLHALASVDVDIVRLEGPPSPAMSSASRC